MDAVAEAAARETASDGADRANAAGLDATAQVVRADATAAEAILRAAGERDVTSVVVGSRVRSGFRSALLGSVSNTVVQHSDRPVIVVHGERAEPTD